MNNALPNPVVDSELSAMRHWAKLVDTGKAPRYEPKGKPVFDPNSLPKPQ